jgi:copper resistance protein C
MKNIYSSLILLALALLTGTQAQAHAFLDHAQPRVGSTIASSPPQVKIWFTEELEGAFSRIEVFDAKGAEVDRKDSKIDPANGAIMTVSLPQLGPGDYKVKWSAVATDTHHTTGTFIFTVKSP